MITDKNKLIKILGLRPTGDYGPYTLYTSKRHKTVVFPRSPPTKPPSAKQTRQRIRWKNVATAWRQASNATRTAWTTAAKQAGLKITGHNLFFWYALTGDAETIHTIERQTSIPLITAPQID